MRPCSGETGVGRPDNNLFYFRVPQTHQFFLFVPQHLLLSVLSLVWALFLKISPLSSARSSFVINSSCFLYLSCPEMSATQGDPCPQRLSDALLLALLMSSITLCGRRGNNKATETAGLEESCQTEKFVKVLYICTM